MRAVELPPGSNGAKQGVDDFLVANGECPFRDLVGTARLVVNETRPISVEAGRTDAANAVRLISRFGSIVHWVGPWDKWVTWDGKRWRLDGVLQIECYAKQVANQLWKELTAKMKEGVTEAVVKVMYAFAKHSNNVAGVRAMVALARSEAGVPIEQSRLDSDLWLLNLENGTLDLRTGELREPRQADYITKLAPVTFNACADCPRWRKFLQTIFNGNEELIGYAQRLVGYNLTGVTEEHILPFMYGSGANGKTTFVEAVRKLLGSDYAMKAAPDLLMAKRGESHPTDRADLFGKRFVACAETEDGRRLAEALVKELTGGDRVRARRMREDFWEFSPTRHVWLAGNYKPRIIGTDLGIWRRIKLIPFEVTIPDDEQDKKLPAKLAAEMSGILNWAIEGCRDWQHNGMQEPAMVKAATKEYSDEMDDVGQFIGEGCELGPEFMAPATELYLAYQEAMPNSRMSQQSFGTSLARRGYEKGRITSGVNKAKHGWKGLRLRSDAEAASLAKQSKKIVESMRRQVQGKR